MIGKGSYYKGWTSSQPYQQLSKGITRNREAWIGHVIEVDYETTPGKIKVRLIGSTAEILDEDVVTEAYPIDLNIIKFPVPGETVLIIQGFYNEVNKGSFVTAYYYVSTITSNNSLTYNSDPFIGQSLPVPIADIVITDEFIHRFENKLISKDSFIDEDSKVKEKAPLKPYEGDFILQGRFGSSIRLGSTSAKTETNQWSKDGGEPGNPIMVISSNKTVGSTLVSEDVNLNDSIIYLCSSQVIPLNMSTSDGLKSYKYSYDMDFKITDRDLTQFQVAQAHTYNIPRYDTGHSGTGGSAAQNVDINRIANGLETVLSQRGNNPPATPGSTQFYGMGSSTQTSIYIPLGTQNAQVDTTGILTRQNELLDTLNIRYLVNEEYTNNQQLKSANSLYTVRPYSMGFITQPIITTGSALPPINYTVGNVNVTEAIRQATENSASVKVVLNNNYGIGNGETLNIAGSKRVGGLLNSTTPLPNLSKRVRTDDESGIRNITLHHTAGEGRGDGTVGGVVSRGASIQYVVDGDGVIWNGSDGDHRLVCFHGDDHNRYGIGIELQSMGSLKKEYFPNDANKAVADKNNKIFPNYRFVGNGERLIDAYDSSCPTADMDYEHRMFDRDIINLGFQWNNSYYYQDFTDRQILGLATLMRFIIEKHPHIGKALEGKNVYEEVFRIPKNLLKNGVPIYGKIYGTHGANHGVNYNGKFDKSPTDYTGVVIHASAKKMGHDDTFPSPRLVKMLCDVFKMTAGYTTFNGPGNVIYTSYNNAIALPYEVFKVKRTKPVGPGAKGGAPQIVEYYQLQAKKSNGNYSYDFSDINNAQFTNNTRYFGWKTRTDNKNFVYKGDIFYNTV